MGTQLPSPKRGRANNFRPVYCSQTAWWTKMALGMEIGLGPGHIVLDGNQAAPSEKGGTAPQLSAHVYCGQTVGWIKMPFSWCWHWLHLVIRSTHMEYISCVSAGSVNCSLIVINDAAERSVALVLHFNQSITKNEAEMQTLLHVVADHRGRLPDTRKSTLKATSVQSYWNSTS